MKNRIQSILDKIEDIEYFIAQKDGKIILAPEDRILKPAIRMQIISIAEQFNKLKDEFEFELLSKIRQRRFKRAQCRKKLYRS